MNYALIIAGGSGNRMGQDIPKQFMHVDNCPIIIHTMMAFQKHPDIQGIAVVCLAGWETVLQSYANQFCITKLKWIFPGGSNGQESIHNGIYGLKEMGCVDDDLVLVHDAVRPLLSQDIISSNIAICQKYGYAITGIKCREAILESEDGFTTNTSIPRDKLIRTQTPQTFRLGNLIAAHEEAKEKGITNSVASCTLMAELGGTSSMRGYYEGRYRDKHSLEATVELRQHVWKRNGIVVWAGAGTVFPKFSALRSRQILPNAGVGYRWEFKKNVNVRLDYGFGKSGQSGFLFNINEAF